MMYGRRLSVLSSLAPSGRNSRQGERQERSNSIVEGSVSDSQASEHLQPDEPAPSRPSSRRSSKRPSKVDKT